MQKQSNLIIEDSILNIEYGFSYKFSMPTNYIIYFEKEREIALDIYINPLGVII